MLDHISVSQINLYLMCSLKYRFNYIDQLEKPFKPAGLAFGSSFHAALEWLHKQRLNDEDYSPDTLVSIFKADWQAQNCEEIRFKKGDSAESLRDTGEKMLLKYLEQVPRTKPREVELEFRIPLINPETGEILELDLKGVIDLIEENDTIVDHKTSARVMDENAIANSLQLTAYSYAYRQLFGRKESGIRIDNITKTKRPRIERFPAVRNEQDHVRLFSIAKGVLTGILNEIFIPNPSWMCADCEFAEHCRNWKGDLISHNKILEEVKL
ncbi:PD-(D/E)XK nuclease family protein [bacterium]|nr:MAG: PD-(D/E)XK nuclease family protein [bacterium]